MAKIKRKTIWIKKKRKKEQEQKKKELKKIRSKDNEEKEEDEQHNERTKRREDDMKFVLPIKREQKNLHLLYFFPHQNVLWLYSFSAVDWRVYGSQY